MIKSIKRHYPLIIAILILYLMLTILTLLSIRNTRGNLIYAIDDPYIHMAIAKNFAEYGVWGVTRYGFTSSSSSPFWTLLLSAIYSIFGVNQVCPFILNIIFATLLCILVYEILRKHRLKSSLILIVLLIIFFFTPLPSIIFTGQEHTIHVLISIFFVYVSANILTSTKSKFKEILLLLLLSMLVISIRYEGLFLVFVVCCLLMIRRKPLHALLTGATGILPIYFYGIHSLSNGWNFFPNSILLKGRMPESYSFTSVMKFFINFFDRIMAINNSHIFMLILLAIVLLYLQIRRYKKIWDKRIVMLIILVATAILHMLFADTGWFFRYEAYLVGLGITVLAISVPKFFIDAAKSKLNKWKVSLNILLILLILLTIVPFSVRGFDALRKIPQATKNIYEQQYQIGLFLSKYYEGEGVAANDIGAIDFLADIRVLDVWGLANIDVAKAIRKKYYTTDFVSNLAAKKNIRIAVIYDIALQEYGGIPSQWIKLGAWKISNNIVCGDDSVSFYAVDTSEADNLMRNLKDFSSHLPKDVVQTGEYTKLRQQ